MNDMLPIKRSKVLAYVTSARGLLVFRQPAAPEAGLQVPAGTVELGESMPRAVLRELLEETGIRATMRPRLLGRRWIDMRPFGRTEVHRRSFFAIHLGGAHPEQWRHWERHCSDGSDPIAYDLFWHDLRLGPPELAAEQGALLPRLLGLAEGGAELHLHVARSRRTPGDPGDP